MTTPDTHQDIRSLAERCAGVLDSLPTSTAILAPDGRIVAVNLTWRRHADSRGLGMERYGVGSNYLRVCSAADPRQAPEAVAAERGLREVLNGRRNHFTLDYACHSPGQRRWYQLRASPLPQRRGAVVVHTDITDLKLAQEGLVHSERRWRRLVESLPDALLLLHRGRDVELANPAAVALLGAERLGRLEGTRWHELIHAEDREQAAELSTATSGASTRARLRLHRLDGATFHADVRSVRTDATPVSAHLLIVRDVTEQVRADEEVERLNEQLLHSQKLEAVGRLAGGVAHDFNNLLTAINGFCELLLEHTEGEPELHPWALEIHRAGQRAADLTQKLLTFSRRQPARLTVVDLHDKIEEVVPMVRQVLGPAIDLQLRLRADPSVVEADPTQLEQVLVNLVINARDAMPGGGELEVRTTTGNLPDGGAAVVLTVRDTGCGMDDEVLSRMFEPFFTTKGTGSGLGLATTYGIVEEAGGHIEVDSEPGRGTELSLWWPTAAGHGAAPAPDPERSAPPAPAHRSTILVVEDEAPLRRLIRAVLEPHGHRLLLAADGREALDLAAAEDAVDLLLTDLTLPGGLDGRQLARRVRRRWPQVAVLVISAHDAANPAEQVEELHLPKPFSGRALLAAVHEVLDRDDSQDR